MTAIRLRSRFSRRAVARVCSAAFGVLAACSTLALPGFAEEFGLLAPADRSAPSPEVVGLDGAPFRIRPADGRPLIVHFFATWCAPCRDELPRLVSFARAHGDSVATLGVDVSEPAVRVRKFLEPFGVGFPVALDEDRAASAAFAVRGLPGTMVIGPGGRVALAAAGPVDWDAPETLASIRALSPSNDTDNDNTPEGTTP